MFLLGLSLLLGLGILVFFWLPYAQARSLADLLARDGSLDSFSPARYARVQPLRWFGLLLVLAASAGWWRRERLALYLQTWLELAREEMRAFGKDARSFFRPSDQAARAGPAAWLVLGLLIISALNKWVWLARPLGHDEAYTYIAFASRPIQYLLRDYHLPNNHIFHSLLVHISTGLLGNQPWALRLPAFIAGVLLVPAAYLAGKAWYGRSAALLLAGFVAVLPVLREYSTRGRGYSLLLLFALLSIYLAARLLLERNRMGWLLFGLVTVLGFYTIPIYLYPFGVIFSWLALSGLAGQARPAYGRAFWKYLFATTLAAGLVTLSLYLPVFLYSGVGSVTANSFVQPLGWVEFWASLWARGHLTLKEWSQGLPGWVWISLWLGFVVSLVGQRRLRVFKIPLPLAWLLAMGAVLLWQRVAPENRVWLFSLPYFLLAASGGLVGGAGWLWARGRRGWRAPFASWARRMPAAALGLALATLAVWGGLQAWQGWQNIRVVTMGSTEQAMQWLSQQMAAQDILLVNIEEGPAAWYYGRYYGLVDEQLFKLEPQEDATAWVLVHAGRYGEGLQDVLALYPKIASQLAASQADLRLDLGEVRVYELPASP